MQISTNIQDDSAQAIAMSTDVFDQTIAPDDEIVAAAQAGSSAAVEALHSIYSRRLYQTIFSITRNSGARVLKEFLPFSTAFECF
jgi:hypothetical protein